MAGAPERPVVLRRRGILKDPDDDAFLQNPRARSEKSSDTLELFAAESYESGRSDARRDAVGEHIAAPPDDAARNPLIGVIVVAVLFFVTAVWAIDWVFGTGGASTGDSTPATAAAPSAASSSTGAAAATRAPKATTLRAAENPAARNEPVASDTAATESNSILVAATAQTNVLDSVAPLASTAVAEDSPGSTSIVANVADRTIYSAQDIDVLPPRTAEKLPGPTITAWTTRTNAMEVIVSETGAVERVRLVTPPARMPDTFMLSRAKMWQFTPATKEGRPVRYRLLLTWEVNP